MYTPKGYTDIDAIENYLLIDVAGYFEPQVNEWIAGVEVEIDKETGRNFIADALASVRTFDGNGERILQIPDAYTITQVQIGRTGEAPTIYTGVGTDFFLRSSNGSAPYRSIELDSDTFLRGRQNILITGKWGSTLAVPADVKWAATVMVAGIINFSLQQEGEVQSLSIGRYAVTYKDEKQANDFERAKSIIQRYKRYRF